MKPCPNCRRPRGLPHHVMGVCDMVKLSDGRVVHANRVEIGGDLREMLGDNLKVTERFVTSEMRKMAAK